MGGECREIVGLDTEYGKVEAGELEGLAEGISLCNSIGVDNFSHWVALRFYIAIELRRQVPCGHVPRGIASPEDLLAHYRNSRFAG